MKYDSILDTIGQTPLVRIDPAVHGLRSTELYAKLEFFNPFGSVKDRAAWGMARPAIGDAAERGAEVVELSSGNTAKALAVIASMHGLGFRSVTNRMKIPEVKELLLLLGAEIEELPGQSECLDPTDTEDPLTRFHRELSAPGGSFLHTDQYFNPANARAHEEGTGPEIIADLDGRAPDWFIAGVGTAGSSSGVARALRAARGDVRVLGLVAEKSDFVPGIRNLDEVQEVGLFDPATYDLIEAVGSLDAIDGMVELIRRCGILAGPTGGAAYYGAVRRLREVEASEPGRQRTAVFVVCDRVESYLSYVRARRPELLGASASLATRTAASVGEEERAGVHRMPVAEAQKWLLHEQPLVVDLRGPHAYAAQHIEGSVNIADELFAELLRGGLPFSKSRPVLLACPVGEKSVGYAAVLSRMGHPDVRSLDGGVIAWRDAGAPLVRE